MLAASELCVKPGTPTSARLGTDLGPTAGRLVAVLPRPVIGVVVPLPIVDVAAHVHVVGKATWIIVHPAADGRIVPAAVLKVERNVVVDLLALVVGIDVDEVFDLRFSIYVFRKLSTNSQSTSAGNRADPIAIMVAIGDGRTVNSER